MFKRFSSILIKFSRIPQNQNLTYFKVQFPPSKLLRENRRLVDRLRRIRRDALKRLRLAQADAAHYFVTRAHAQRHSTGQNHFEKRFGGAFGGVVFAEGFEVETGTFAAFSDLFEPFGDSLFKRLRRGEVGRRWLRCEGFCESRGNQFFESFLGENVFFIFFGFWLFCIVFCFVFDVNFSKTFISN